MNLSGFVDEVNATFQLFDVNVTEQPLQPGLYLSDAVHKLKYVMSDVCFVLGAPGNILSVIIWLRRHVTSKNSSALYLAVLAISDLVFLLFETFIRVIPKWYRGVSDSWLYLCIKIVWRTTIILEPLLVLGFSVERLIAISCPLQVRCMCIIVYV